MGKSYFDGTVLGLIFRRFLCRLLIVVTLGIGYPWAICMMTRWEAKHTVINTKRLKFTGKGLQLIGTWILLSLIPYAVAAGILLALGIIRDMPPGSQARAFILLLIGILIFALFYGSFVEIQMMKWTIKHTEFEIWSPEDSAKEVPAASQAYPVQGSRSVPVGQPLADVILNSIWYITISSIVALGGIGLMFFGYMIAGVIASIVGVILLLITYNN